MALGQIGQLAQAIRLLREVLATEPGNLEALNHLTLCLRKAGQLEEALKAGRRMIECAPGVVDGHSSVGLTLLALKRPAEAASCFEQCIRLAPNFSLFHMNAGVAYRSSQRLTEAEKAFRRVIEIDPNVRPAYVQLAGVLVEANRGPEATQFFKKAYDLDPDSFAGKLNLAAALKEEGDAEAMLSPLREAIEMAPPGISEPFDMMGAALQQLGRFPESEVYIRKAIEISPDIARPYFGLTLSAKFKEEDRPIIAQMERIVAKAEEPPVSMANLHYGLGKAYQDLKEYGNAMPHYEEANRIRFRFTEKVFNPSYQVAMFDRIISTFDKRHFERYCPLGSDSIRPVFVVGMPRSGTTLTEQILSSHPSVGGGGETRFWQDMEAELFDAKNVQPGAEGLAKVADSFLALLEELAPGKPMVIDKQPLNFTYIGLIHTVFPKAKIIHCRRHPVDNCLSIFVTPYRNGLSWGHSRARIVSAYRQYLRLMEHWRRVLPKGVMLDIDYEDLVNDQEATTRAMIDFLGLEWDDACLRPEDNERSISTPSVWQARQPVYRTSLQRWRSFEPWLGEFRELLTEEEIASIGDASTA